MLPKLTDRGVADGSPWEIEDCDEDDTVAYSPRAISMTSNGLPKTGMVSFGPLGYCSCWLPVNTGFWLYRTAFKLDGRGH